ncbi:MAG: hypothetical protein J1G30_03780 [Spirochaetales bacterium]|nr:hypothetical protein [Spirochaetales bacterium]
MMLSEQSEVVIRNKAVCSAVIILLSLFISCRNSVQIYPEQEVSLFTELPFYRADTIHEAAPYLGYGAVFCQEDGFVSYPALYLSNDDETAGESFVLLGFPKVISENRNSQYILELSVNYAQRQLNNLEIRLYPILKAWDSHTITYSQFEAGEYIKESLFLRYYFSLNEVRLPEKIKSLPFERIPQTLQFDVTPLKNEAAQWYGIAIFIASTGNSDYITSGKGKMVCSSGNVELIPSYWQKWNGTTDDSFSIPYGKWLAVKNKLYCRKKYCPVLKVYR